MKKRIKALFLVMATLIMTMMFAVMVSAAPVAPGKVTGLKQTDAGTTNVNFSWDAQIAGHYQVELSTDNVNWTKINDTSLASETEYGLSSGKVYYARVRAYEKEYVSGVGYEYAYGEYSDVVQLVTVPDDVESITQTAATTNSATFTWTPVEGATSYKVIIDVNGIEKEVGTVATNSINITGLSHEEFSVKVISIKTSPSGFSAMDDYGKKLYSSDINLVPLKVSGLVIDTYYPSSKKVWAEWEKALFADGYQVQVYRTDKKKPQKTYNINSNSDYEVITNIKRTQFYKYRVRAYTTINGNAQYGEWSDYTFFSQQPVMELEKLSSTKYELSWKKVKGATSYTVYMSTKKKTGYKKVKTLKKTSLVITKFKKKKLSSKKTYYFYVVANKKVGKKTIVSDAYEYTYWGY